MQQLVTCPLAWLISFILALGTASPLYCQTPQGLQYQAVARDAAGQVLANESLSVRFTVLRGTPAGQAVYSETHAATTNAQGLFSLVIGQGTPQLGSFGAISWASADHYLKVEIDPAGGDNYLALSTTQLLSAPYAFVADTVLNPPAGDDWGDQVAATDATLKGDGGPVFPLGLAPQGATQGQLLKWNGNAWVPGNDQVTGPDTLLTAPRLAGNGTPSSPLDIAAQNADTGQVLKWNGNTWLPATDEGARYSGQAPINVDSTALTIGLQIGSGLSIQSGQLAVQSPGGDLSGTIGAATVTGLQGRPLATTQPASGDVLRWNGAFWEPASAATNLQGGNGISLAGNTINNTAWTLASGNAYRSSGNVGIGLTNPLAGLDIGRNSALTDPQLNLYETEDDFSKITFTNNQTSFFWAIAGVPSNAQDGRLNFYASKNGIDVMSLNQAGQVGIGTTNPLPVTQLDVFTGRRHAGYFETDTASAQGTALMGIYGGSGQRNALGVYGESLPADGYGLGGEFQGGSIGASGYGLGGNYNGNFAIIGVYGEGTANVPPGQGEAIGVFGNAVGAVDFNYGLYGTHNSSGSVNYAGYFQGAVHVNGLLSKSAGAFRIDHPQDPANKFLVHSFVESPDMMNIYNGNVTTDAKGYATVKLPAYFSALNKSFRYQLTPVGQFAQAIVAEEITKKNGSNQFVIQTDKPNVQVSWQVTGVRDDPYARQHRIEPVQEKPSSLKGRYLHPELYGQPAERGMHRPEARRSGKAQPRSSQRKAGRSKRGTTAPAGPQRFPQHQRP